MSIRVLNHIWLCDLPPNELLFLQAIGDCADDQYLAHPSWSYLAWKTGLSRKTISRFAKKFRENGALVPVDEVARGGIVYLIKIEGLPKKKPWRLKRNPRRSKSKATDVTVTPVESEPTGDAMTPAQNDDWCHPVLPLVSPSPSTGVKRGSAIRKNRQEPSGTSSSELQTAVAPSSPSVLTLPCCGKDEKEFPVTEEQISEWREAFPGVDVVSEVHRMRLWLKANPIKRKTYRGMPRFCFFWLERTQNSGRGSLQKISSNKPERHRPRSAADKMDDQVVAWDRAHGGGGTA